MCVVQFMQELSAAWQMTVDSRLGLFAPDKEQTSPLVYSQIDSLRPTPPSVLPHLLWTWVSLHAEHNHQRV